MEAMALVVNEVEPAKSRTKLITLIISNRLSKFELIKTIRAEGLTGGEF
jgi:hypothetical protein